MSHPTATAGELLPQVLALIEKIEFHQCRMEELCAAVLELTHPEDDLACELNRLLRALRQE